MSRINAQDSQVDQGAHVPQHHSNFDLSNNMYRTYRFGEYAPFFFIDSYEKDKIHQRNITTTRSLSLKAPLMEDINMKRDYFQVYYDALLPINWDKLYVRPKNGDIADWLQSSTNVPDFGTLICNMCQFVWNNVDSAGLEVLPFLDTLTFIELFFSDGALINHFGCHLSPLLRATWKPFGSSQNDRSKTTNFDKFFDGVMMVFTDYLSRYASGSVSQPLLYSLTDDTENTFPVETAADLRLMLTYIREGGVSAIYADSSLTSNLNAFLSNSSLWFASSSGAGSFPLNLAPFWAYQICCAHFYSDDNVDYIFSAELFRSLVGSYVQNELGLSTFTYNGVEYQYDFMSSYYFQQFIVDVQDGNFESDLPYFRLLFGYNRSLRFQDYFAGARPRPIAIGNETEIAVNDGKVSVIDVTLSIQWQRLLNNIQRLPQEIGRYIQASTGKSQSFDYHNPGWLAHTKDTIFAAEVENTGTSQMTDANSVTSTLRGKSSNKEFTFESDRPCVIVGIQYFDIRRAYYTGIRRTLMYESREDMFMPELQYIGDQPLYNIELFSGTAVAPFGYTEQYNWLKTNYDEAMGGFVNDSLPGWAFLFRPEFFKFDRRVDGSPLRISPNFIRSVAPELDEFFLSLTGFSLGTYFHFQQKVVNITPVSRNMVRHSQILQ